MIWEITAQGPETTGTTILALRLFGSLLDAAEAQREAFEDSAVEGLGVGIHPSQRRGS